MVADQVGTPTWAGLFAGALWELALRPEVDGILHWSDLGVASWYDFAVAIQEEALARGLLERAVPVEPIRTEDYPTPARRPAYSVLDKSASWPHWPRRACTGARRCARCSTDLKRTDEGNPMTRILLVTGAAGFIGANFCHYWHARHPGDRLVAYDALTYAGNRANLRALDGADNFSFVHADIADTAASAGLLREEAIDTIVHFAAESHVDRSIDGPDAFIATNVVGTHSLLKAAREIWLGGKGAAEHRFHHVSTDEVFGSLEADAPAFTETHTYAPNSPYSASKAASDYLVRAYHHTYGLQVTTSNCSNNYGPWHFPEKLIPLCIVNILQGRSLCRSTATDATSATGSTSRTIAAASSWCCRRARSARPTTSAATTSGRTSIS